VVYQRVAHHTPEGEASAAVEGEIEIASGVIE
jgi:hypothetical protein